MLRIKLSEKLIDYYIAKPIFDNDSKIIYPEETKLTLPVFEKLKQKKVKFVYLKLEGYEEIKYNDILFPDNQKINLLKLINDFIIIIQKNFSIDKNQIIMKNDFKENIEKQINHILKIIDDVIFFSDENSLTNFVEYRFDYDFFQIKILLNLIFIGYYCKNLDLSKNIINKILKGVLFIDLGYLFLPKKMRDVNYYYKQEDEKYLNIHPILSEKFFNIIFPNETEISNWILSHHERITGTGYPKKLRELSFSSQIIPIIDTFVTLKYMSKYKNMISPEIIYNIISEEHFPEKLVKVFKKTIIPFMIGQTVFLSENKFAVVKDIHTFNFFTPVLKIIDFDNLENKDAIEIDTFSDKNYKITGYLW